jgi:hypothetical protein
MDTCFLLHIAQGMKLEPRKKIIMLVCTKLFDVLPDDEPIRFESFRSSTVLIELSICK